MSSLNKPSWPPTTYDEVANHSNVISLIDAFSTDEYLFVVLEYAPGGTLADAIVEGQRFCGETTFFMYSLYFYA
uniref:Kinase-like protein n=1 Tax=Mycena chlorophos TaxID=658473 RepID=A0ABQ0LVK9_MYCCL|nr:kinase-like protein [Mycena chlorophos]